MCWQTQLIGLYVTISTVWEKELAGLVERRSNNKKQFLTDSELVTIYFYGLMTGRRNLKDIHKFADDHLRVWFPKLPSYQGFCYRTHKLPNAFMTLCERIQQYCAATQNLENKWLLDSMPIVLAQGSRSFGAKIARGTANKGYCSSKKLHYHGVKLHVVGSYVSGSIPVPYSVIVTNASMHDLTAARETIESLTDGILLCDKAYCDSSLKEKCKAENDLLLITPIKKPKNGKLDENQIEFSKAVSKYRQPIESFFNWINEKTGIQIACKIRSAKGLAVHIFGKLAAAMLMRIMPTG
jgi:hypothetical protein